MLFLAQLSCRWSTHMSHWISDKEVGGYHELVPSKEKHPREKAEWEVWAKGLAEGEFKYWILNIKWVQTVSVNRFKYFIHCKFSSQPFLHSTNIYWVLYSPGVQIRRLGKSKLSGSKSQSAQVWSWPWLILGNTVTKDQRRPRTMGLCTVLGRMCQPVSGSLA